MRSKNSGLKVKNKFLTKENKVRADLLFKNSGNEVATTKYLPKFINKIENYNFKYTFVRVVFESYEFTISIFDKPRDLKEKIAEISNEPKFRRNAYRIRLVDKESYIYGDDILIDFEPVYNSLIRGLPLYIKCVQKSNVEKKNIFIRFWACNKDETFWLDQQRKNQSLPDKADEEN